MRRLLALGVLASLGLAAPASAAEVAINGTAALTWDPQDVAVAVGDSVTWQFPDTTQAHNINSDGADVDDPDWTAFKHDTALPAPPQTFTFKTAGTYKFICTVHSTTMFGTVTVGAAAPPPPRVIPLSEQPFGNDAGPLGALERVDEDKAAPRLSSVSARRTARGAVRVRFRVSEESTVRVRLKRRGRVAKTVSDDAEGVGALRVSGLKAGRYRIDVLATDIAGNKSSRKKVALTVR
jgi:plastocyanin